MTVVVGASDTILRRLIVLTMPILFSLTWSIPGHKISAHNVDYFQQLDAKIGVGGVLYHTSKRVALSGFVQVGSALRPYEKFQFAKGIPLPSNDDFSRHAPLEPASPSIQGTQSLSACSLNAGTARHKRFRNFPLRGWTRTAD
jgi:hypothetical protein